MQPRHFPRGFQVSPHLMLLTVKQLAKENAELSEEVKQLRAAVNVYRELAERKAPSLSKLRAATDQPGDPRRSNVA